MSDNNGKNNRFIDDNNVIVIEDKDTVKVFEDNYQETPDGDPLISECYILGDNDEIETKPAVINGLIQKINETARRRERRNNGLTNTDEQSDGYDDRDIVAKSFLDFANGLVNGDDKTKALNIANDILEPSYDPHTLLHYSEVDAVHSRCVKTKVSDSVGREYNILANTMSPDRILDVSKLTDEEKKLVHDETILVRQFILDCSFTNDFEMELEAAAMDYEAIGFSALRVVRSRDMRIAKLEHLPAKQVRKLKGDRGYIQHLDGGGFVLYQPFGKKVIANKLDALKNVVYYDPYKHGSIDITELNWNLVSKESLTKLPSEQFDFSADELLWLNKVHPKNKDYGLPDIVSALGDIIGNVNIRDYFLQFFENNTIPHYAIVIQGAGMTSDVISKIKEYFRVHIKGKSHSTLVIPIPSRAGKNVEVKFEKLGQENKEGSFQETRKNNVQNILTAHGVSPAIIGIAEAANLGSGKGLSQAEIYKDRIISPSQRRWARLINRLFRLGLGIRYVELSFDPLDIRDQELEQTVLCGYQKHGDLNINEVRTSAKLGDPIVGGDRYCFETKGGIQFVDELVDQKSSEIIKLETDIEKLREQLQVKQDMQQHDLDARDKQQKEILEHQMRLSQERMTNPKQPIKLGDKNRSKLPQTGRRIRFAKRIV